MKGRLLIKIAGIAGAVALLAGATFGFFTSNPVTITNITLESATPTLQIWNGASWVTTADLGISETNMYPGWVGSEHTFALKNATGGVVPFGEILPAIVAGAVPDWTELKDIVQMAFGEVGGSWTTSWRSLSDWYTDPTVDMLDADLLDGDQRWFRVKFQMPTGDDTAKGKTLTFTLSFVAQTP